MENFTHADFNVYNWKVFQFSAIIGALISSFRLHSYILRFNLLDKFSLCAIIHCLLVDSSGTPLMQEVPSKRLNVFPQIHPLSQPALRQKGQLNSESLPRRCGTRNLITSENAIGKKLECEAAY